MKKVLAVLLASYAFSNGQTIPPLPANPNPQATTIPATVTTAPVTTAVPIITAAPVVTSSPLTTAAQATSTQAAQTTRAQTTAAQAQTTNAPATTARLASTTAATAAATTAAATTSAPAQTTAKPETTAALSNPFCPAGRVYQELGITGPTANRVQTSQQALCDASTGAGSVAIDWDGMLKCDPYHCCLCSEINCGGSGKPCDRLQITSHGATGVQNIIATGADPNMYGPNRDGAEVECSGMESCKSAYMRGEFLKQVQCSGDLACESANMLLEPSRDFKVECNGLQSCYGSRIEIVSSPSNPIRDINGIEFNGEASGQDAHVLVRNLNANPLIIENFECMNPTACVGLTVEFVGDVRVRNCDLQGVGNVLSLPLTLQQCVNGMPFVNPGFQPWNPIAPAPQTGNPFVPAPATTLAPVNPAPGTTAAQTAPQTTAAATLPGTTSANVPATTARNVPGTTAAATPRATSLAPLPPATTVAATTAAPAPLVFIEPPANLFPNAAATLTCNMASPCNGQAFKIEISQNFKLECTETGACNDLTLWLVAGVDPLKPGEFVTKIDSLKFVAPSAAVGATIKIENANGGAHGNLEVGDVRCEKGASCGGLTIDAGANVDIWNTNVDCQEATSCVNCSVKSGALEKGCVVAGQSSAGWGTAPGTNTNTNTNPSVPAPAPVTYPNGINPAWAVY